MTNAPVTDADREAAKRFVYDYNVRDIFQAREAPIEELTDMLARARAEGAASEREACAVEHAERLLSEHRARRAHDSECESEFDSQVHAQTPCGCAARRAAEVSRDRP